MEVGDQSDAHFQLVALNGRARLNQTRSRFELPRTREAASPLEWQRKILRTRNRDRMAANDTLQS